jgi:hypothetical protein
MSKKFEELVAESGADELIEAAGREMDRHNNDAAQVLVSIAQCRLLERMASDLRDIERRVSRMS